MADADHAHRPHSRRDLRRFGRVPASAIRRSTTAGARRGWPMSCAIPSEHPDAIIPDLSKPDPLLTFSTDDVAFVYGSKWKQRYFQKVGDDYFPLPAQWDVMQQGLAPYLVADGTDWWTAFYPADNFQRPTGPLCDGCHSVNYDIETKTVTEWNVGCERCHGPGSAHVQQPTRDDDPESGAHGLCPGQRHLHPVPFAGTAADESDRGKILRLAGRLSRRPATSPTSGSSKSTSSAKPPSPISRTAPATRTACRATISCRA